MVQLYVLHWSRPDCLGILGWWFPWLMRSELLHLAYAVYMLGGLYHFRRQSYHKAWITATHLQSFHLIEHVLLLTQLLLALNQQASVVCGLNELNCILFIT
ncbi:MAG: hypothetical protein HC764_26965 [Pleurocapsa sp. CRU_1_2]|nr:hypothetical protein [Pleurocapsa sp. CRU_1_2]